MATIMKRSQFWNHICWCLLLAPAALLFGACRQSERFSPTSTATPSPVAESPADQVEIPAASKEEWTVPDPPADALPAEAAQAADRPQAAEPAGEMESEEPESEEPQYDPQKSVPLVDRPERLQRLDPKDPVWFDKQGQRVVMTGQICGREVPLEMFACLRGTKEHEAIVVVDAKAYVVHAGLVAAGADPGNPVQFYPEYVPAKGPEIEVTVVWEDEKGQRRIARGQDWIRNAETRKAMEYPWVFAGSQFTKDEQTGREFYLADGGDFICVSNFPSAMLDLPIKSSDSNTALLFEAFTERIPPLGTPVTLILTAKAGQP